MALLRCAGELPRDPVGWLSVIFFSSYLRYSRSSTDPSGSAPPRSCGPSRCRSGSWSGTSRGSRASSRYPRRWSWGWRRRKPPPWSAASWRPCCTASCLLLWSSHTAAADFCPSVCDLRGEHVAAWRELGAHLGLDVVSVNRADRLLSHFKTSRVNVSPSQAKIPQWSHEQVQLSLDSLQLNCRWHRLAPPLIRLNHAPKSSTVDSSTVHGAGICVSHRSCYKMRLFLTKWGGESSDVSSTPCMFISSFSFIEITSHSQVPTHWPTLILIFKLNNLNPHFDLFQNPICMSPINIICHNPISLIPRILSHSPHTQHITSQDS